MSLNDRGDLWSLRLNVGSGDRCGASEESYWSELEFARQLAGD